MANSGLVHEKRSNDALERHLNAAIALENFLISDIGRKDVLAAHFERLPIPQFANELSMTARNYGKDIPELWDGHHETTTMTLRN